MRLPLTVIGGYLGAGKTTLINRLLSEDHGLRLLVMVNDFGAINIDAGLLKSATDDTLELSNGCVCCTMGADLFMAVGDVLDRPERPDHLVIEASGIADPARIAQVAQTEPELAYGGIAVLVDALAYDDLSRDLQIGAQLRSQVDVADILLVSKTEDGAWPEALGRPALDLGEVDQIAPLLVGLRPGAVPQPGVSHAQYVSWNDPDPKPQSRERLTALMQNRPKGLLRFKGVVPDGDAGWEVHGVGKTWSIKPREPGTPTGVVGIGLKSRISVSDIRDWWAMALTA